jgi:SAM-dependent methyltransferase
MARNSVGKKVIEERLAPGATGDLGVGRLIHDGILYDAQNTFSSDYPFYLREARRARGPVCELCCGTGRLTIPLAAAGLDLSGVDISPSMLARARRKAREAGVAIRFRRQDIRRLALGRRFSLIFIPFNSLQNTYRLRDLERVFQGVRRHLGPEGRFILDVFNPNIDFMVRGRSLRRGCYRFRLPDGTPVSVDEQCAYDDARQINRVTWFYRIGRAAPVRQQLDMRCFYPEELDALLRYNGFRLLRKYGDYQRSPFSPGSPKQICVCQPAG